LKPKREYVDYASDIRDAAEKAQLFAAGIDFEGFQANDEKVFAVIRALEIIGEASKKIPASIRKRYPEVPWAAMAGMRDKLAHDLLRSELAQAMGDSSERSPSFEQSHHAFGRRLGAEIESLPRAFPLSQRGARDSRAAYRARTGDCC
jgi:uncharacterized protein with HEPN domain